MPINIVYYTIFFIMVQPYLPKQQTLGQAVGKSARNIFNRTVGRLFGDKLNKGAEKGKFGGNPGTARWTKRSGATDWRVKLTVPTGSSLLNDVFGFGKGTNVGTTGINYRILDPLADSGGIVFPLTRPRAHRRCRRYKSNYGTRYEGKSFFGLKFIFKLFSATFFCI